MRSWFPFLINWCNFSSITTTSITRNNHFFISIRFLITMTYLCINPIIWIALNMSSQFSKFLFGSERIDLNQRSLLDLIWASLNLINQSRRKKTILINILQFNKNKMTQINIIDSQISDLTRSKCIMNEGNSNKIGRWKKFALNLSPNNSLSLSQSKEHSCIDSLPKYEEPTSLLPITCF